MRRLLILSPHLDDAILDCCNHIIHWKKEYEIAVINIFTKFGEKTTNQELIRKKEDAKVMKELNILSANWNFIDGKYRKFKNKLIYKDERSLFLANISELDFYLLSKLKMKISKLRDFDRILIPLGVGKHTDHVITKKVALETLPKKNLWFYVDFPYALRFDSWSMANLREILGKKISIKLMSSSKLRLLTYYKTQYYLLFKSTPNYPEIIFTSK